MKFAAFAAFAACAVLLVGGVVWASESGPTLETIEETIAAFAGRGFTLDTEQCDAAQKHFVEVECGTGLVFLDGRNAPDVDVVLVPASGAEDSFEVLVLSSAFDSADPNSTRVLSTQLLPTTQPSAKAKPMTSAYRANVLVVCNGTCDHNADAIKAALNDL